MPENQQKTQDGSGVNQGPLIDQALEYADEGIAVFPVARSKHPAWSNEELGVERGRGGFHIATTDHDEIVRLFGHPRAAGIGVPTGKITGRTVVDVDCGRGKAKAAEAKAWLEANRRTTLWGASVVRTQSGGLQYHCAYTPGIPTAADVFGPGVDCRNDGGFGILPPYLGYRWERITDPDDWPTAPPPVKKPARERQRREITGGETPREVKVMIDALRASSAAEGSGWHTAMISIVAHLVGSGWTDAAILHFVPQWTKRGFTHRETFEQVATAIDGARKKWNRRDDPKTTGDARIQRVLEALDLCTEQERAAVLRKIGEPGNE